MWTQVSWQLFWSAVAITVFASMVGTHHRMDWNRRVLGVLILNWVLSTSAAYWLWNRALSVLPVAKAGQIISLVPVLAVIASAIFMKEAVGAMAIVSIGLIVCGIFVTLRSRRPQPG